MSDNKSQTAIFTIVFFLFGTLILLAPANVYGAKKRVWTTIPAKTSQTTTANRPSFSVKFRADRRALNVNFYGLTTADSTSYELTYIGNGLEQGVVGSIYATEGASASRLLLFGTCSKAVCTYHKNISNMQLKITSKLKTGKTLIKTYKIKV